MPKVIAVRLAIGLLALVAAGRADAYRPDLCKAQADGDRARLHLCDCLDIAAEENLGHALLIDAIHNADDFGRADAYTQSLVAVCFEESGLPLKSAPIAVTPVLLGAN